MDSSEEMSQAICVAVSYTCYFFKWEIWIIYNTRLSALALLKRKCDLKHCFHLRVSGEIRCPLGSVRHVISILK